MNKLILTAGMIAFALSGSQAHAGSDRVKAETGHKQRLVPGDMVFFGHDVTRLSLSNRGGKSKLVIPPANTKPKGCKCRERSEPDNHYMDDDVPAG